MTARQAYIKLGDIPDGWSEEAADFFNKLLIRKPENRLGYRGAHEDGLTERGFITFIEDAYMSEDGEAKVRQWLNLLGYDSELYPLRSRCFMLTFHSDTPISVSVRDALNTDLNSKVNKLILKSLGEEINKEFIQRI